MATIQIPVLFDMSGDTIIFGEEATGDFVGSHLDFLLDMTTEANDISLNAADISAAILVGDQDTGDNIFYSGGSSGNVAVDNLCNRIAKAITRGKLVHIPKTGNSSNSGIPMGGRLYVVRADGQQELPPDGQYAEKYPHSIAPIGDEQMLGEAMTRVTSVHLMGTPLPASILVNKNSVQSDLETTTGQTFNDGNTSFYNALAVQLSKVLGGSKSSAPMNNGSGSGNSGSGTTDPYDVASSNSTLSGQTYTSSSSLVDWPAEKAFDTLPVDMSPDQGTQKVAWISADNKYSNSNYSGSETTDGYSGEWVQVDIGQSIVLKEYKLLPRPWADDIHPAAMRLFSSTDGTNWTQIQDWTGLTLANWKDGAAGNTGTYKTLGPYTTNTTGRYFRLVVNKLITGNYNLAQIGEIELKGMLPSEESSGSSSGYPLDASGTSVPALKSIYEQLMNVPGRSQIMPTRDISGVQDNSNVTLTGGFPFIPGDKLVMYLRPKIVFAAQTQAENNNALFTFNYTGKKVVGVPVYNIADKNGDITGQTYTHSSSQNNTGFIFEKATTGAGITGANFWSSAGNTYAATTGLHEGSNANGTTTNVDVGVTPPTTTTTHIVTVGDNGGNKFKIDGAFNPTLSFVKGNTYIFDQSDATNSGHQIQISETPDGGNTSYVTATGTPGSAGAKTTVVVPTNASATLYYNCNPHGSGMGNSINVTNPPNSISGEWGQVDIGQSTWATELKLTTNNSYNERMPVEFRLLGSIDGTNWKTLIHETEAAPWVDNTPVTFTIPNPEPLRYYRYVVIKTHGDAELRTSLGHFDLRGVKYPSEITEVSDPGLMSGTTLDISGLQTNVVASSANINDAFPGNATSGPEAEPSKWGWMGSANSDSLSLDTTDVTDPRTIDLHIWKITITL